MPPRAVQAVAFLGGGRGEHHGEHQQQDGHAEGGDGARRLHLAGARQEEEEEEVERAWGRVGVLSVINDLDDTSHDCSTQSGGIQEAPLRGAEREANS